MKKLNKSFIKDFLFQKKSSLKISAAVACVFSALSLSSMAVAAPLNITGIGGGWTGVVGGSNVAITNVAAGAIDTVTWGDGILPDSGYTFTPGASILGVVPGTNFLLGTFTHNNIVIPGGTGITAIDYGLTLDTNGIPANLASTLQFAHNETSNVGGPPASDDIVTITAASLNSQIIVGTDTFFFNLLGFSSNSGTTFSQTFSSPEGQSNSVQLFARVTSTPIPEPGTIALLGMGLMGLVGSGYRKRKVK